jgi:hypothetical protein
MIKMKTVAYLYGYNTTYTWYSVTIVSTALATMLLAFILQIIIHVRIKKDTEKLIEMESKV